MAHVVARFASTSLDVIEHWCPSKLLFHFEGAQDLQKLLKDLN